MSFANNNARQLIEILSKEVNDGLLVETTTLSNILVFMEDVVSMDFSKEPCGPKDHERPSKLMFDILKRGYGLALNQQSAEADVSIDSDVEKRTKV